MNPVTARTESMTGQDSACLQMPASLRTSQQRCNNLHKAVVAQNQLTWQTLIHILTFLKARAKGEGTDTPIFVLYFFFTRTKFTGNFSQQRREWTEGGIAGVCPSKIKEGFIEPHLTTKNVWMKTQPSSKA